LQAAWFFENARLSDGSSSLPTSVAAARAFARRRKARVEADFRDIAVWAWRLEPDTIAHLVG